LKADGKATVPKVAPALSFPSAPRVPPQLSAAGAVVLNTDLLWEGLSIGADFSRQVAEDPVISGCRLTGASFVGSEVVRARVSDTVFQRCDLSRADLYGAQLGGAYLFNCSLTEAEMSKAILKDARLHGSTFDGIKGADALRGCTIGSAQVMPVAYQLLAVMGITVDDEAGPGPSAT
jgi:uncharacterized protein YjbI with pentapeptide repeats